MYMYTQKQIEKLESFGFVVKQKTVSDLKQFDKVFYQTRPVEPNSHSIVTHYVEFFSWTMTEKCHCHLDWKYYDRRHKHIRSLVDTENGYEFEDYNIYMAEDRLVHNKHTMDSRRYAPNDKDKKPYKEHLIMTCYDEELEPIILAVYSDDVVFVLEDMSNVKRTVDVHIVGVPSENDYFQPYISEGLRSPVAFYDYLFNSPFNKKCVDCSNNDIPYAQIHNKSYFGNYDLKSNLETAYDDITMKLELADQVIENKTYTEAMAKEYNNMDENFVSALRVLEDLVPTNLKNKLWAEHNVWKRFMIAIDIYNDLKKRYKEINSKNWSHDDYLYVLFGSNVKRKSRKVLEY